MANVQGFDIYICTESTTSRIYNESYKDNTTYFDEARFDTTVNTNNGIDRVYFTDGLSNTKRIRASYPTPDYYKSDEVFLSDFPERLTYNQGMAPRSVLRKVGSSSGGTIKDGSYYFSFRFKNEDLNLFSKFSPLSERYLSVIDGSEYEEVPNIYIEVDPVDYELYTHIELYTIAYINSKEVPDVIKFGDYEIEEESFIFPDSIAEFKYTLDSESLATNVTLEDIVVDKAQLESIKTIDSKDGYLFGGNVKYKDTSLDNGYPSAGSSEVVVGSSVNSPLVSTRNSYFRDEVYRFGVVFYDKYGNYSSAYPLDLSDMTYNKSSTMDVKFPSRDSGDVVLSANNAFGIRADNLNEGNPQDNDSSIGIKLSSIQNYPSWAEGALIVRAKRKKDILYQSPLVVPSVIQQASSHGEYPPEGATLGDLTGVIVPKDFSFISRRDIIRFDSGRKDIANDKAIQTTGAVDYLPGSIKNAGFLYPPELLYNNGTGSVGDVIDPNFIQLCDIAQVQYYLNEVEYLKSTTKAEGRLADFKDLDLNYNLRLRQFLYQPSVSTSVPNLASIAASTVSVPSPGLGGYYESFKDSSLKIKTFSSIPLGTTGVAVGRLTRGASIVCDPSSIQGSLNEGYRPIHPASYFVTLEDNGIGDISWFGSFYSSTITDLDQTPYNSWRKIPDDRFISSPIIPEWTNTTENLQKGNSIMGDSALLSQYYIDKYDLPAPLTSRNFQVFSCFQDATYGESLSDGKASRNMHSIAFDKYYSNLQDQEADVRQFTSIGIYNCKEGLSDDRYGSDDSELEWVPTGVNVSIKDIGKDIYVFGGDCVISQFTFKVNTSSYRITLPDYTGETKEDYSAHVKESWGNSFLDGDTGITATNSTERQVQRAVPVKGIGQSISVVLESTIAENYRAKESGDTFDQITTSGDLEYYLKRQGIAACDPPKVFTTFSNSKSNNEFQTRVVYSDKSIRNTTVEGFDTFRVLSFYDLDESFGDLTKIKSLGDNLIGIQENAVTSIPVNKSIVQTADGVSMTLSSGQVIPTTNVVARDSGTSNIRNIGWSGNHMVYMDENRKKVFMIGGGTSSVLSEKGMSSYFREFLDDSELNGIVFDSIRDEYWFVLRGLVDRILVYSLKTQSWISEFEFGTSKIQGGCNQFGKFFFAGFTSDVFDNSVDDSETGGIWEMYSGDYNSFMGNLRTPSISMIVNPSSDNPCTFDNLAIASSDAPESCRFYVDDDYYPSNPTDTGFFLVGDSRNREGTFRVKSLRDMSSKQRIRGRVCGVDIEFPLSSSNAHKIHSAITKFRISK